MKKVLIVDDELEILSAVRSILEDEGFEVETSSDGAQAVELMSRGRPPDLVLSDVMMPKLSGFELVARMRAERPLKSIPVILMSGVNPTISRSVGRWDDFIRKPFTVDALMDAIKRQLG
jgi:CheY-like chemotaxis protein